MVLPHYLQTKISKKGECPALERANFRASSKPIGALLPYGLPHPESALPHSIPYKNFLSGRRGRRLPIPASPVRREPYRDFSSFPPAFPGKDRGNFLPARTSFSQNRSSPDTKRMENRPLHNQTVSFCRTSTGHRDLPESTQEALGAGRYRPLGNVPVLLEPSVLQKNGAAFLPRLQMALHSEKPPVQARGNNPGSNLPKEKGRFGTGGTVPDLGGKPLQAGAAGHPFHPIDIRYPSPAPHQGKGGR